MHRTHQAGRTGKFRNVESTLKNSTLEELPRIKYFCDTMKSCTNTYDSAGVTFSVTEYGYNNPNQTCTAPCHAQNSISTMQFEPFWDLYYYGHRFYSPNLHTWLNRDPIQDKPMVAMLKVESFDINGEIVLRTKVESDSQTTHFEKTDLLHLYAFCNNSPTSWFDPNGRHGQKWLPDPNQDTVEIQIHCITGSLNKWVSYGNYPRYCRFKPKNRSALVTQLEEAEADLEEHVCKAAMGTSEATVGQAMKNYW